MWSGWGNKYIAQEATLPFKKYLTSCDTSSMGDGVCDDANNDMACDFDGGDCCSATCSGDDDEACVAFNCIAPYGLDNWAFITSNDDITYPFTTQKALLDVLQAKTGNVSD